MLRIYRLPGTPQKTSQNAKGSQGFNRAYGGLKVDQARWLKELERENSRLKRAVAELTLDKQILKEAAERELLIRPFHQGPDCRRKLPVKNGDPG